MSVYSVKGKGWRYDFTHQKQRQTEAWFRTKREALAAEAKRREELKNPEPQNIYMETPAAMDFFDLMNLRLDYVKEYRSKKHYQAYFYCGQRWVKDWGNLRCEAISTEMIQKYMVRRKRNISPYAANHDLTYLKALFNWAVKKGYIDHNPADGIEFFPVEKKPKYVPSPEDIEKVINVADPDTRDYLVTFQETLGRMGEINRLTWDDVNLDRRYVVLYTRKKKGGSLTPRKVPMTDRLYDVMSRRFRSRDKTKPWVFWHTYWSSKTGEKHEGPYQDRKRIMKSLCAKAGVRYFRFHALRHAGATMLDNSPDVRLGSIQRILGHESRKTTEIYLHSIDGVDREAMAAFEAMRKKSHTESHTNETGATCGSM